MTTQEAIPQEPSDELTENLSELLQVLDHLMRTLLDLKHIFGPSRRVEELLGNLQSLRAAMEQGSDPVAILKLFTMEILEVSEHLRKSARLPVRAVFGEKLARYRDLKPQDFERTSRGASLSRRYPLGTRVKP